MQDSKSGLSIKGQVEYVSETRIWVEYQYRGNKFRIEMPRTKDNENLKHKDKIEFALLILKD